jgi:thiol:disulfide interchange protein DsbD
MSDAQMAGVIRTLTEALTPVAPLGTVRVRAWKWGALSALSLGSAAWLLGLHPDLLASAVSPALISQVLAMGALAGIAAIAALRLSVPGADRRGGRVLTLALLGLWPCALVAWGLAGSAAAPGIAVEPWHLVCARTIGIIALVPAIALISMIRRGAPLRLRWGLAMAGMAAAGVGALGVALTCPISRPSHLLVAHALPTVAIAVAIGVAASWIVRRRPVSLVLGIVGFFALMAVVSARETSSEIAAGALPSFHVSATTGGYMASDALLEFLHAAERGVPQTGLFEGQTPLLIGVAILLGGVLLNFTPCVLPMIPVNLAIIGAGEHASSRRRGWLLGAAYGSAMAVVYGLLGGIIVATTGTFGGLNSSPWFNAAIAALFLALGLAMFDVFFIDFSRWSGRIRVNGEARGRLVLAFFMGGVAALLAGACVAPVVIQVVALSGRLYSGGAQSALLLPLFLGIGMGLPWPFAGAGLAALPKPGTWMIRVKQGLGVCILVTAAYYGYEAVGLARAHRVVPTTAVDGWYQSLDEGLSAARRDGKPVFLDVWATWCKNCVAMDATTFRDPQVGEALDGYVKVRFQAEDIERPDVAALLDRLESVGLPTYAVLRPAAQN